MAKCLTCSRELGYTDSLPIVKTKKKVGKRTIIERSNGPRTSFRVGYYGHGFFCTTICAGSYGLAAALDAGEKKSYDGPHGSQADKNHECGDPEDVREGGAKQREHPPTESEHPVREG